MDVIEVVDFKKSFGSKIVHRGINLKVREGECVGLIGGSGSGKSVILRSMIGLEKADEGKVIVNGTNINGLNEEQLVAIRKKVAYVFQGGALFDSMTVGANLAYPLREHTRLDEKQIKEKIATVLESFGLKGAETVMPANLSGGMQKRVGLARAMIMDPDVVLFDEPTAGLDPYNTRKIQEKIIEFKARGKTSILVTHDMPSAFATCDRMVLLLNGVIAAEGTATELMNSKNGIMQNFINGEQS